MQGTTLVAHGCVHHILYWQPRLRMHTCIVDSTEIGSRFPEQGCCRQSSTFITAAMQVPSDLAVPCQHVLSVCVWGLCLGSWSANSGSNSNLFFAVFTASSFSQQSASVIASVSRVNAPGLVCPVIRQMRQNSPVSSPMWSHMHNTAHHFAYCDEYELQLVAHSQLHTCQSLQPMTNATSQKASRTE